MCLNAKSIAPRQHLFVDAKLRKNTIVWNEGKKQNPRRVLIKWLFILSIVYLGAGVVLGLLSFYDIHDASEENLLHIKAEPAHADVPMEQPRSSKLNAAEIHKIEFQDLKSDSQQVLKGAWNLCVEDSVKRSPNILIPTELLFDVQYVENVFVLEQNVRRFEQCVMRNGFHQFVLEKSRIKKSGSGSYRLMMP